MSTASIMQWIKRNPAFSLLLLWAVFSTGWRIALGSSAFSSDEALGALMSAHILEGEFPLYYWGQAYYGSLYMYGAAPVLLLLGKGSVIAYRLPQIALIVAISFAFVRLISLQWDRRSALLGLTVFLLPTLYVVKFLRAGAHVRLLFLLLIFLLLFAWWRSMKLGAVRVSLLGLLLGFSLWISPTFSFHCFLVAFVMILASPEWRSVHAKLSTVHRALPTIVWWAVLGIIFMTCTRILTRDIGRALVNEHAMWLFFSCVVVLLFLFHSRQRLVQLGMFTCGFLLGNAPQLLGRFYFGLIPDVKILATYTELPSVRIWIDEIFPALVGFYPAEDPWSLIALLCTVFAAALILLYCLLHRAALVSFLLGRPTERFRSLPACIFLLFAGPIYAQYVQGALSINVVRNLQDARLALAVMIGVSLSWCIARWPRKGTAIASVFLLLVAVFSQVPVFSHAEDIHPNFQEEIISDLESYLREHDVQGGYAPYTVAYPINFLTEERITIAPDLYVAAKRRIAYRKFVDGEKRFAYVAEPEFIQVVPSSHDPDDLIQAIIKKQGKEPGGKGYYWQLLQRLRQSKTIDRRSVSKWDVWILEQKSRESTSS